MIDRGLYTTYTTVDLPLDIDIKLLDSRIYTSNNPPEKNSIRDLKEGEIFLCVKIRIRFESFDSVSQGSTYARPRLLIILGILSFITQRVFSSFEFYSVSTGIGEFDDPQIEKFNLNKENLLDEIEIIRNFIQNQERGKQRLFFSLIDRWRKAFFLEERSSENSLYNDEITLSYFHILELLSSEYYRFQKDDAKLLINQFTSSMLRKIYYSAGNRFENEKLAKSKLIESVFLSELSVGSKILYMLDKQGLLTENVNSFISDLVANRNSVAHGRQVYQESVIFPVPPFFPLIKNHDYSFEFLRYLTGRSISVFINSNLYEEEWSEFELYLMPPLQKVTAFINSKLFEELSNESYCSGENYGITPSTISFYLLKKKIKPELAYEALKDFVITSTNSDEEIYQAIVPVILFIDIVEEKRVKDKCIEMIKIAADNSCIPYGFDMRDMLYYLENAGFNPKTLRELLKKKMIK